MRDLYSLGFCLSIGEYSMLRFSASESKNLLLF
jgi:hypothetical protein